MKDNTWAYDVESKIFTIVKKNVAPKIATKFPNARFTMVDRTTQTPVFPTIYIHQNGGVEERKSLETDAIESVRLTMQIDVMTNTTQADASYVFNKVCDEMKRLGFVIVSMPTFNNLDEVYRKTARFRRFIEATDVIN